jgi:DNA topoisomerase IB
MARLRRADCSRPGIIRRKRGRGFHYVRDDGRAVKDKATLARIRELAIPPAWTEVWICPDPLGHLQATGFDDAGRKQYLYHAQWQELRNRNKFDEAIEFGKALPKLRRRTAADLAGKDMGRARVLACAVRLLDLGFFRIGSERYAEDNASFGLATIRKTHVSLNGREISFDFPAKSGRRHVQSVADKEVLPVVRKLKRRRGGGRELLAYRDDGHWVDVRSQDINDYIKEATGGEFSAKDFRTWNATVLAALNLAADDPTELSAAARRRRINEAVAVVADYLGNTPAVCRRSYIDPRVFDRFDSGETVGPALGRIAADPSGFPDRAKIERAVIRLLS